MQVMAKVLWVGLPLYKMAYQMGVWLDGLSEQADVCVVVVWMDAGITGLGYYEKVTVCGCSLS